MQGRCVSDWQVRSVDGGQLQDVAEAVGGHAHLHAVRPPRGGDDDASEARRQPAVALGDDASGIHDGARAGADDFARIRSHTRHASIEP